MLHNFLLSAGSGLVLVLMLEEVRSFSRFSIVRFFVLNLFPPPSRSSPSSTSTAGSTLSATTMPGLPASRLTTSSTTTCVESIVPSSRWHELMLSFCFVVQMYVSVVLIDSNERQKLIRNLVCFLQTGNSQTRSSSSSRRSLSCSSTYSTTPPPLLSATPNSTEGLRFPGFPLSPT